MKITEDELKMKITTYSNRSQCINVSMFIVFLFLLKVFEYYNDIQSSIVFSVPINGTLGICILY